MLRFQANNSSINLQDRAIPHCHVIDTKLLRVDDDHLIAW